MRTLLSCSVFIFAFGAHARDLSLILENNHGVALFLSEKKTEAYEQFIGLTAKDPQDLQVRFNIASSLQALTEEEKALKIYQNLLADIAELLKTTTETPQIVELQKLRYAILYNMGVGYQVMQDIDKALKHYQQALELVPDSQEIKTNIELMFSGGQGKGKGDNKDKKDQSEGEGDSDPNDQENKDQQNKDQQQDQKENQSPKDQKRDNKQKQFDQKYMSNEDLKRIMEELKEQEQSIRAKMERKGGKSAPKDKEW